jgi:hypothetical protein
VPPTIQQAIAEIQPTEADDRKHERGVQVNDLVKPLLVFAATPYGVVGALMALAITGTVFGFMAFLGIARLIGQIGRAGHRNCGSPYPRFVRLAACPEALTQSRIIAAGVAG